MNPKHHTKTLPLIQEHERQQHIATLTHIAVLPKTGG